MSEPIDWPSLIGFVPVKRRGPMVIVSGTVGLDEDGSVAFPDDSSKQARRALERVRERLQSVGADLEDVLHTRLLISRRADWQAIGRAHGEFFAELRPASTLLYADLLDDQFLVEIEVTAWVGE